MPARTAPWRSPAIALLISAALAGLVWRLTSDPIELPPAGGFQPDGTLAPDVAVVQRGTLEALPDSDDRASLPQDLGTRVSRVRVRGEALRPVQLATITHCRDLDSRILGSTNAVGELSASLPAFGRGRLIARDPGTGDSGWFCWNDQPPLEIDIQIAPTLPIQGQIESLDGVLPSLGVRAVAIPEHLENTPVPDLDRLLASTEVLVAGVAPDGGFRIQGALQGTAYSVYATARGYVTTDYSRNVLASDSSARVRIARLYGTRVVLSGPEGERLRAAPDLFHSSAPAWRMSDSDAIRVEDLSDRLRALSGLPANSMDAGGQHDRLLLYTSRAWADEIGPLEYFGRIPGYEPFEIRIPVPALEVLGEVPRFERRLQSQAAGWGSLRVSFPGGPVDRWSPSDSCGVLGVVRLYSTSEAYLEFAVRSIPVAGLLQDGIPWGEYEAVFFAVTNIYRSPRREEPQTVVRISGQEATTSISLEAMGAAFLEIDFGESGPPPDSVLVSIYAEGNDSPYFGRACAENAYLLAGLAPWTYRFEVTSPVRTQRSDSIVVAPGRTSHARLRAR